MLGRAHARMRLSRCAGASGERERSSGTSISWSARRIAPASSRYFTSMPADGGGARGECGGDIVPDVCGDHRHVEGGGQKVVFPAPSSVLPEAGSIGRASRPWRRQGVLGSTSAAFSKGSGPWRCRAKPTCTAGWASQFVPPELREDMGEIEAAEAGTLPRLVELADIPGRSTSIPT